MGPNQQASTYVSWRKMGKNLCRGFHARVAAELVQRGREWRIKENWLVGSSCYGKNDGFL